tara:strand:+ start:3640 stop:4098 length:459 start_codon:yes stop_codon:yes gene_type:complete
MKIDHPTFEDTRGSFTAIDSKFMDEDWDQFNIGVNNNKFTFRGLHYQTNPPQTKCIKVIQGSILDIWYDLGTKEIHAFNLNNEEFLYIPSKYAHGYLTLTPNTIVTYLVKGEYNPESEHSIVWDTIPSIKKIVDSHLQGCTIWLSDKDRLGK